MRIIRRLILSLLATLLGMWVGSGVDAATAARSMPGTVHAAYCYDHDAAMCPRALVSGTCHGNAPPSPFVAASVSVGILPYSMSEPASTTPSSRSVATEAGSTVRHYTTSEAAESIVKGGEIAPRSSDKIWVTLEHGWLG